MVEKLLTGDESIAEGAVNSDVKVITGYPGSPSTKVLEHVNTLLRHDRSRHVEWSVNEKVALEVALGASIGGDRSMVCLKSVGMNIAIDPIMTANLTGVNAGMVIILGDDPGAFLSQNEQDTRLIADLLEVPFLEPSTPQEAMDMVSYAFELSEEMKTIVIVRETRGLSSMKQKVRVSDYKRSEPKGFIRAKNLWISTTFNVLDNHRGLHRKLENIRESFEISPFNVQINGLGTELHIITSGFTFTKLVQAFIDEFGTASPEGFAVLKLGTIYPIPTNTVVRFLKGSKSVLVLEDNEPYIEEKVKAIAKDANLGVQVMGKNSGHVPRVGDLLIRPGFWRLSGEIEIQEPSSQLERTFCDGCPYTPTFKVLSEVIVELGQKPVIIAEPGCAVRLNAPPFEMLDVKYSLGSAIGIASGLALSSANVKPIAVCGDSSFFHTGVNALFNAAQNKVNIFVLVLDNSVTALTGYQPHPGTGHNIRGDKTIAVKIEEIAKVSNVSSISVVDPDDEDVMRSEFRKAMGSDGLCLVVVRKPCPLAGNV